MATQKKKSKTTKTSSTTSQKSSSKEGKSQAKPKFTRPPVVTLMGHVDHGKTTLLDSIRKSELIKKEYGGITQHIGAYQVTHKGREITFIDTPGHAAFAKMRAHGARVTDLVVLVVAANDGVKPQTREALAHIRAARVPFLVAINKIDLPDANLERVKGQLAEEKVIIEDYGGETVAVEVSAKTRRNLDQLLDMILLLSDLQELKADPNAELEAVVIETRQDKRKGILVTLLVKNGTLQLGSSIDINNQTFRIRAMNDENGKSIKQAGPGSPVEILGFKTLPAVGQLIGKKQESTDEILKEKIQVSQKLLAKKESEDQDNSQIEEEEQRQSIKILVKADTTGTLEAITSNLSDEVEIVDQAVGEVTESDVLLAQATLATIYAFNTKVSTSAQKLADIERVKLKTYNIIYKLFEDLEAQVLKMLEPTIDEETLGEAEIIAEFEINSERIAGCKVKKGEINKQQPIHIMRNEEIIADTKIRSLRRSKQEVDQVKAGTECGISFKSKVDFKLGDAIISYRKLVED